MNMNHSGLSFGTVVADTYNVIQYKVLHVDMNVGQVYLVIDLRHERNFVKQFPWDRQLQERILEQAKAKPIVQLPLRTLYQQPYKILQGERS